MKRIELLVFSLLLVGCVLAITVLPTPTNIPVYLSPSATATKELPTPTPSATLTSIPIPTLLVDDARARLLELLASNENCQLPCLWGITPGKSTYRETQTILIPLSDLSYSVYLDSPESGGGIISRYTEGDLEIYTTFSFIINSDNEIVNHIASEVEMHKPLQEGGYENVFDSDFFGDSIAAYTLPHVLSTQGIPSSVMIATAGGPLTRGGTGGFEILLLYPDRGILVNYTTQMHLVGAIVRGCPINAHVEMELYPKGNSVSFFELLQQTDWSIKFNYYKPLEEVATMSVDEFYQIFRGPTDKCVETPANLWATPEP